MTNVSYLVLRRMRLPLIVILVIYTFCTVGLAVMPGVDAAGNPTPGIGLFPAFYVISYTGTTIGFGEIPVPYSGAQRLWMTLSIYLTVIGWSYTILTVLSVAQDPAIRQVVRAGRFAGKVRAIREHFYIVCGVGETGTLVCRGLDRLDLRFVVLESDQTRFEEIQLEEFRHDPPTAMTDAAQPDALLAAGLMSPLCRGVVAVTQDDLTNQAIAVNVRMLRPTVPVLARIRDLELETHIGVFGGDIVINPFERFAEQLTSAIVAPRRFHLHQILTGLAGDPLPELHRPPKGHWIMCGYGRFGHAVVDELKQAGLTVSVVDVTHYGEEDVDVKGRGTEPGTLEAAGIDRAVGIVVGNKEDQRNLAIAILARELKPSIFVVTRQNQIASAALFQAFADDFCMEPSRIVAQEFLAVITTPLLARYLNLLPEMNEEECANVADRISALPSGRIPEIESISVVPNRAALYRRVKAGQTVRIGDLLRHPGDRQLTVDAIPLLHLHSREITREPSVDTVLRTGDRILFAAPADALRSIQTTTVNDNVLGYSLTGDEQPGGWLFRNLRRPERSEAQAPDQ